MKLPEIKLRFGVPYKGVPESLEAIMGNPKTPNILIEYHIYSI